LVIGESKLKEMVRAEIVLHHFFWGVFEPCVKILGVAPLFKKKGLSSSEFFQISIHCHYEISLVFR